MEQAPAVRDHPKRIRRRRTDKPPISAWLLASDHLKGDNLTIPLDLLKELCGHRSPSANQYIAFTPWYPSTEVPVEDAAWTILPFRIPDVVEDIERDSDEPCGPLIRYPAASLAWKGLVETLQDGALSKSIGQGRKGAQVRILDVEPLVLDTVYVTVDGEALKKHEEVQKEFGGGFNYAGKYGSAGKGKGKAKAASKNDGGDRRDGGTHFPELDDRLASAVRDALAVLVVARQNRLFNLPFPAHPITHVPLPPARITLCEPVSQGLLNETTRIIVDRASHTRSANRNLPNLVAQKALNGMSLADGDETSIEQFVSAAEDEDMSEGPNSGFSSSNESIDDSDESSNGSLQDMISMSTPQLSNHALGSLRSGSAATPRPGSTQMNGISTPGSVFSNYTATTARQGPRTSAKLFKTKAIVGKIPDELLQPKPAADEDEEARVFVEMKTLMKVCCFSGDWVQVEAASCSWDSHLDALATEGSQKRARPAKIYGLSDLSQTQTPRFARSRDTGRRSSVPSGVDVHSTNAEVWMSPILLANLDQTESVRIIPLLEPALETLNSRARTKRHKISTSSCPPTAQVMTVLRISTPLTTERALQTGIFTALKHHFEAKRRILKKGDLIALPVDIGVSRMVAQPIGAMDADQVTEELLSHTALTSSPTSNLDVAWFRVGQITIFEAEAKPHGSSATDWGGAACIEPTFTRMRQTGSESSKIPSSLNNPWQFYLGIRPPVRLLSGTSSAKQYVSPTCKEYISSLRRRLRELLAAATSPQAFQLRLDPTFILLHSTQRNIGKAFLASHAAMDIGLHVFDIDAHDVATEGGNMGDVKTEAILRARIERALSCGPTCTAIVIRHIDALVADRIATTLKEVVLGIRVIVATTTDIESVSDGIRSLVTHELEVSAPDEGEREGILRSVVEDRAISLAHDVDLDSVAVKSAALVAGDLVDIVDRALVARQERLEQIASKRSINSEGPEKALIRDVLVCGGKQARCMIKADFDFAVEAARKNFADAIGAPKIPNVSWDDVGGLENVKDAVMETIQLPLERPELFAKGMKKRSGILFYGPPGTGKTLLAKAIATEFSLNFFSVKGPELLNMYIGESEANVRRVFQRARDARPCVVFFDELDSVAPKRGNQGDSGGVMDRIVSQLLAELDGMSEGDEGVGSVFVIGATNRPDLLDQALLRPGRFDKMLYLGVSDAHDKQLTILEALTRKFTLHPDISLRRVAESLPFTYTGADLYALCSDAMLKAITRQASAVDARIQALPNGPVTTAYFFDHLATAEDIAVTVMEKDFSAAQRELVGSVSAKEIEHYNRVRHTFEAPLRPQSTENPRPTQTRIPGPAIDGHLEPPVLTTRPKLKGRSSTAKPEAKREPKGKGKRKVMNWDSDDDDDDDAYVTSNDFAATPERRKSGVNGDFGGVGDNDDEELYG